MSVGAVSGDSSIGAPSKGVESVVNKKGRIKCEALIKPEKGGPLQKCNKVVDVALQAVKCSCGKDHCKKHFDRVAHDCPVQSDATRSVAKSCFLGQSSKSSNQAY